MRDYTDEQYKELFEDSSDEILNSFMEKELEIIKQIEDSKDKTFIDLGAGHGRLTPILSEIAKNVVSIEIHPKMIPELKKRGSRFENTKVIVGNISELSKELKTEEVKNPVLLLLQNTLSVIEEGSEKRVLEEMKKIAEENRGEIIISLAKAEALESWGVKQLYPKVSEMFGNPDLEKTNFEKGVFVSDAGFTSNWKFKNEIDEIIKFFGGKIIQDVETDNWRILHLGYN